ncbi:MAG: Ig-like domain-containing protein [Flavobacteriales bacterium]|nr:Ig-like domain-containing protein [Flavobacteriales bacterium]
MKSRFFLPLTLLFILVSCAQVRTVSGGEKDMTPPTVLFADPAFLSTNITPKKITFTFDEYVQLNNIQQELIVSPPLSHQPQIKIKGKTLELNFQDTLLANTTYQINFGDGVGDVNRKQQSARFDFCFQHRFNH